MATAALIVAAGRGSRAQPSASDATQTAGPKQYARIKGRTVLGHAIEAFTSHPSVDQVLVVVHGADLDAYEAVTEDGASEKLLPPVEGGATRQQSVRAGLEALAQAQAPDTVLIHDAARPFVSSDVIDRVVRALTHHTGAIAGVALADTLQRTSETGLITETLSREGLWRAQTPQGFAFAAVYDAHRKASDVGQESFTDDATLVAWAGHEVVVVAGSEHNTKLTTKEDLAMAADGTGETRLLPRMGNGYDVHRCDKGDHVWLCGVRVPSSFALSGHSDADVGLHALTDAILGALGDGDIGTHFPPSDTQWKGAASHIFLADAAKRVRTAGGAIGNVDVTLICESPKIQPHRARMCAEVASILDISPDRVSVKATTTEGLGLTGRGEGVAAMATATVFLPEVA
ncbi:MAG: bifunctional 2-C-methyl-D-erythritol 4-phosphate cytidylyltransferase/2-C-methyl-D-erythritol 2,4-cyclodiphosphate synthase [Alphaproteobacteria bacterium]|nr:bifunctional 2-C-methyl-D-erythritol 4-phosphate cytidylyltransferase/2-C-methyl-D-erythritol 2,4-cyclodiphosphate synthase [Alphaproteobacteria bacterium]